MGGGGKILPELEKLEKKLKYRFQSHDTLWQALTHSSRANEEGRPGYDYEVLEFLGDAVLSFVVSDMLCQAFPDLLVGDLSRMRANLVKEESLAARARILQLGDFLRLGKSERTGHGDANPSLLADVYEAVLAAVFLDGGLGPVRQLLERELRPALRDHRRNPQPTRDPKTRLQEMLQTGDRGMPVYRLVKTSGPPHARCFTVALRIGGRIAARGSGQTKKGAEQQAATVALEKIETSARAAAAARRKPSAAPAAAGKKKKKKKTITRRGKTS